MNFKKIIFFKIIIEPDINLSSSNSVMHVGLVCKNYCERNMFFSHCIKRFIYIGFLSLFAPLILAQLKNENALSQFNLLLLQSLENSKELKALSEQIEIDDYQYLSQLSTHFPQVQFQLKKQKNFFETNSLLMQQLGMTNPHSIAELSYSWKLFDYTQVLNSRESNDQKKLTRLKYQMERENFKVKFKNKFLLYLLSLYKLASVENSINKAQTTFKEAELTFELGQKTKVDVLRARANKTSLDARKLILENERDKNTHALIELSQIAFEDISPFQKMSEKDLLISIENISQVDFQAPRLNSAYASLAHRKLEIENKITKIQLSKLSADHLPNLKIVGAYSQSGDRLQDVFERGTKAHTVALVLSIPLFNGGHLLSSQFQTYHAQNRLQYLTENQKLSIDHQLDLLRSSIDAQEKQVQALKISIDQYDELYRLTQKSYQLGKSTLFELQSVEENVFNAKIEYVQNLIQLTEQKENYLWQTSNF